jgi:1,5-anhydro-D-fructose reductase (1,5-anhydro-D-mannitol-forming)
MINCGIIGFGKMGKIRAKVIEHSGKGRISAIYDMVPPLDCAYPLMANAEEVIESPGIDAVFVCTPNSIIPGLCIQSLQAGKHVFVEKPAGCHAKHVVEIIKAEKVAHGRKLMFGFNHRHHESIRRMKHIVDTGALGRLLWIRGRYGKEIDRSFLDGWRTKPELSGAGILLDQGIHMVDLFIHLGGIYDEISAFVSNLFWKIEGIEDNVFAIFRNSHTGICASLHSSMTQWRYLFSLEVYLEGGALILNGLKTSTGAYGDEILFIKRNLSHMQNGRIEKDEQVVYNADTSWQSEVDHFFVCIDQDTPILYGTSADALTTMEAIDRIYSVGKPKEGTT